LGAEALVLAEEDFFFIGGSGKLRDEG